MPTYQHTQYGTLMLIAFVSCAAVVGTTLSVLPDGNGAAGGLVTLILVVCGLLFHSLTVSVAAEWVSLCFGIGPIRKRFAVSEIVAARIVRNRWYYGWGIRYTPHGWLFNVSGFDAVEIQLEHGRTYRIGTDEPNQLHAAILSAMESRRSKREE